MAKNNPAAYPLTLSVQGVSVPVRELAPGRYESKRNNYAAAPDAAGRLTATHAAKLAKQVYTVLHDIRLWTYGSSAAMLADTDNPLTLDRNRLKYLARHGWPVEANGCRIWRGPLLLATAKKI